MKLFVINFLCFAFLISTSQSAKKLVTRELSDDSKNPLLWLMVKQVDRLESKQIEFQKFLNTKNAVNDELAEKIGRVESKLNNLQVKVDNLQGETSSHKLATETAFTKLRNDVVAIETRLNQSKLFNNLKGSCRSGWKKFDGHCYYFEHSAETWENAKISCEGKGAYLVKIDNEAENKWLYSNIETYKWIGANDRNLEGNFTWVSDNSALRFAQWAPSEPNNHNGNEDCALMYPPPASYWNDYPCDGKFSYICEGEE